MSEAHGQSLEQFSANKAPFLKTASDLVIVLKWNRKLIVLCKQY
jgi:hypothetical protein